MFHNGTSYGFGLIRAPSSDDLTFGIDTGASWFEWMRIMAQTGNVGIGTTNARAKLEVVGGIKTSGGSSSVVELVGNNCAGSSCTATCPAGKVIIFAMGFHGFNYNQDDNIGSAAWGCGSARSYRGTCLGASSCTQTTGCSTTSIMIHCQ